MLLAAVLTVVSSWMIFVSWRAVKKESVHRNDPVSPYLNTRRDVKYVGDAACAGCHAKSSETFRQHPMGRSLAPIQGDTAINGGLAPAKLSSRARASSTR